MCYVLASLLWRAWNKAIPQTLVSLKPYPQLSSFLTSETVPCCSPSATALLASVRPCKTSPENLLLPPWEPFLSSESENLAPGLVSHQLLTGGFKASCPERCSLLHFKFVFKLLSVFAERIGRMVEAEWKNMNVLSIFISCCSSLEKS